MNDKSSGNQRKAGQKEELVRDCQSRTKVVSSLQGRSINQTNYHEEHQLIFEVHQFDLGVALLK